MSKKDWKRRLRLALVEREINQAEIARNLGMTPAAVYHVTGGRKRIKRVIEALIAAGVPAVLFDEEAAA